MFKFQHLGKQPGTAVHFCNPSTEDRDSRVQEHWSASVGEMVQ